jgi:hypothetical protein
MSNIHDLENQLIVTIKLLESEYQSSNDTVIFSYIEKYKDVLSSIQSGLKKDDVKTKSRIILNCARGYMEVSSNYQQGFLNEMGKTEKIIKNL